MTELQKGVQPLKDVSLDEEANLSQEVEHLHAGHWPRVVKGVNDCYGVAHVHFRLRDTMRQAPTRDYCAVYEFAAFYGGVDAEHGATACALKEDVTAVDGHVGHQDVPVLIEIVEVSDDCKRISSLERRGLVRLQPLHLCDCLGREEFQSAFPAIYELSLTVNDQELNGDGIHFAESAAVPFCERERDTVERGPNVVEDICGDHSPLTRNGVFEAHARDVVT